MYEYDMKGCQRGCQLWTDTKFDLESTLNLFTNKRCRRKVNFSIEIVEYLTSLSSPYSIKKYSFTIVKTYVYCTLQWLKTYFSKLLCARLEKQRILLWHCAYEV